MPKVNITLDATMLDTFQSCECKFNYRFNHNKVTTQLAPALDKGVLVHEGLEHYYHALKDKVEYKERVERLEVAVKSRWAESSELDETGFMRIITVLREHCERWRYTDEQFEILAVESPFAYVLHEDENLRLIMIGKMDLVVNWQDGSTYYERLPIDHKSYERDRPYTRKSNQFSNYAKATDSPYLIVNKIGFQTSIKPDIKHKRNVLSYDPLFLDQWKRNTVEWAYRYLECVNTGSWPMNLTSCDKWNRMCEYEEVCNSSGEPARIFKLESMFNTGEKWDVSKSLGIKE